MKSRSAWWLEPVPRIYVAVLFVLLIGLGSVFIAVGVHQGNGITQQARVQKRDEHASCVIQARGLPAGHRLSAAMSDIARLLAFATPALERSRGVSPEAIRLQFALRRDSSAYAAIEAKQPKTRKCRS